MTRDGFEQNVPKSHTLTVLGSSFSTFLQTQHTFTLSIGIPQHGAFFYRAVRAKHHPDVILRALLRQHPYEQLPF